ncbi:hypothetical protein [Colwellia psychrerythraea]|uniref:STAS/SEC14 domain-containing protein n=1 Tax=Colwellia psychrerythraea TaxID=28229 RepID=A0A099KP82_COLPS|nr:hypothetical protein [Colwellia psychrerythraea]KGJ91712.1 hypothetical protein GAB14E_3194 [Colwellia psychrerythraea]
MNIEHGEVTIKVIDNIILVRSIGAFNEYGAQKYTNCIRDAVDDLQDKSFSILTNNLEFLGGTPEAYQELESYNVWLNQQKLIAKAMVITSSTMLDVINMLSPSRASQQTKSFNNEKDAMNWLKSLN